MVGVAQASSRYEMSLEARCLNGNARSLSRVEDHQNRLALHAAVEKAFVENDREDIENVGEKNEKTQA